MANNPTVKTPQRRRAKRQAITTPRTQRAAWTRWAEAHPEAAQANRDAWAKSASGRDWLARNQKLKNARRNAWRKKRRAQKLPVT